MRTPGVGNSSGASGPDFVFDRRQPRGRFLKIRRVAAVCAARDQVFARVGLRHKLIRFRTAHRSGRSFDNRKLDAAARKDSLVSFALIANDLIEPGLDRRQTCRRPS